MPGNNIPCDHPSHDHHTGNPYENTLHKGITCKHCKSRNTIKKGWQKTRFGHEQLYYCKQCTRKYGHIDLLQIRNSLIYIIDFKSGASRENEQKVASQLFFYASGLSFRTRIPLNNFSCAWFDEKVYYEFSQKIST